MKDLGLYPGSVWFVRRRCQDLMLNQPVMILSEPMAGLDGRPRVLIKAFSSKRQKLVLLKDIRPHLLDG